MAEERKGTDVLLVSFILGALLWAGSSMMFIIGVVIGGEPIFGGPGDPFYAVLAASTVFLGPAGWIPTLVAWRRAKDGKSGFKWSVAGGIVMALIGIMLLPGALAIIGGTISKNPE